MALLQAKFKFRIVSCPFLADFVLTHTLKCLQADTFHCLVWIVNVLQWLYVDVIALRSSLLSQPSSITLNRASMPLAATTANTPAIG